MLKDITLGQYFPGNTLAHKLDPRTKILLVVLYIVALFCAEGPASYGLLALTLAVCVRISRVGLRQLVRGLKPVLFILIFTLVLNLFFTSGERYLFEWGVLHVSYAGLRNAFFLVNGFGGARFERIQDEFDEKLLRSLAEITGGSYFHAADADGMKQVMDQINQLEKTTIEQPKYIEFREYAPRLALVALGLLLLGFIADTTWCMRLP